MLQLYLFCLVLGGGFLLVSLFGDALGDAADVELDVEADVDGGAGDTEAGRIFSLRALVYSIFGFGAVGTALTWATPDLAEPVRAAFAAAGGVASGVLILLLFRWLAATDSGELGQDTEFVGLSGAVTLAMSPGTAGTIAVEKGARRYTLRALPHPSGTAVSDDPSAWRSVVVVEMRDGVARVVPVDDDLALEP